MILTCPACGTQYAVKDGAIPEGGRKVRCASCGHSWHQAPESSVSEPGETAASEMNTPVAQPEVPVAEPSPAPGDPAAPASAAEEGFGNAVRAGYEVTDPIPPGGGLVDPPTAIPIPPAEGWEEEDRFDPEKEIPDAEEIAAVRSYGHGDRKRGWMMGALFAVALVIAIVLALWFLAPDSLRQGVGLAAGAPTALQIAPGQPERQKLASGNELVVVSGRVINPSGKPQPVPPIEAQLRDKGGKLVYSWTIAPPARSLPPGGSASFNSAEMDVPASGLESTVTLTLKS